MEPHTTSAAIRLKNLSTGYETRKGPKIITSHINAELPSGELTCLLGPNGSGKSTILRTLCRFLKPVGGEIEIMGRDISSYSQSALSRTLGVVLTEKLMVSNMTVRELLETGRSPYTGFWGRLGIRDEEMIEKAIRLTGIEGFAERQVTTLSDGERQKALIAKVIAQETPLVFLDEPTAFLDYPSKVELMRLLLRLAREEGKTVFLSTHDLELALQMAENLWLLDKKLGLTTGTTDALIQAGEVGRYFDREGITFDSEKGSFIIRG